VFTFAIVGNSFVRLLTPQKGKILANLPAILAILANPCENIFQIGDEDVRSKGSGNEQINTLVAWT